MHRLSTSADTGQRLVILIFFLLENPRSFVPGDFANGMPHHVISFFPFNSVHGEAGTVPPFRNQFSSKAKERAHDILRRCVNGRTEGGGASLVQCMHADMYVYVCMDVWMYVCMEREGDRSIDVIGEMDSLRGG